MITIPQAVLRDCYAVFRLAAPKSKSARSATTVHLLGDRDGIRIQMTQPDVAVEYHHRSPAEPFALTIPLAALADCQGRGDGPVHFQPLEGGRVELQTEQAGVAQRREYVVPESEQTPFPTWPAHDVANAADLLGALEEAMHIASGAAGRLALVHVQLRGKQGDIVASDGRQLLIHRGFEFPWKENVLVARTCIFNSRDLPREGVRVALSKTHVLLRIGNWTIALAIAPSARFPHVDTIIPKEEHAKTRWLVDDDEAAALSNMLDKLPGAKENFAPVTLDLAKPLAIRARAEGGQRCTEVALSRSSVEGKPVRIAIDRHMLQRSLKLGFRVFRIMAPDKAVLCQDGQRVHVWMPLDSKTAIASQIDAVRVSLPAMKNKRRQAEPVSARPHRVEPAVPVTPARTKSRRRVFDIFRNSLRNLWNLVRSHHQKDRVI